MQRHYNVLDPYGLHARPLTILVGQVSKFDCGIFILYNEKKVPLHSLLMAMSLGIPTGGEFIIEVNCENPESVFSVLEETMRKENLIK